MPTSDFFKGVSSIGRPEFTENLKSNIITFCDWGFLNIGAYYNVNIPTSGTYGGNMHVLRPSLDPRYTDGQVWESFRSNWVWESGISQSTQPVSISGVFVDNTFLPLNSGYHINYPEGKVIFDTAQSLSSVVQLEYSYKYIKISDSRNVPWFRQVQNRSFRLDDNNFLSSSGMYTTLSENRLQLPAVIIEAPINRRKEGYELGNSSQWSYTDVVFHVVGEDDVSVSRISDILDRQQEKTIFMFDIGRMADENKYPLDYQGSKNVGALTFPDLVTPTGDGGYRYTKGVYVGKMTVSDSNVQNGNWVHQNLYHQTVKWTTEVVLVHN